MANTITLRAYLDELEHLLDARSPTEVISHCRYILQHYPRNVEAYRLLGQALLERGERDGVTEYYDEALEMFRRVLSVLPDDSVAHLGVSQIFQEKGELERAIWHLERAYEQMPNNQALQEALRELYAQRSGEEAPARLQLTRGALIHQYIRAQQYEQALVELRAALSEAQDERLDLQVLLAEVLWEAGHPEDAAEQAARILEVLPHCLEANRIMARYWLAHERPSDAQRFLERVEAVDPYEARRTLQPQTDAPDPNLLPRLDYGTQAQAATSVETPDWVEELGDLGDFVMEQGSPFTAESEAPAAPLDTEAVFGAAFQAETPADEQPPPIADWAAEASAPPSSPFETDLWPGPEAPSTAAEPSTEADASLDLEADWLAEADLGVPESEAPVAASDDAPLPPDWLDETDLSVPEPEVPVAASDDAPLPPDWLDETDLSVPEPEVPVAASDDAPLPPDWLDETDLSVPEPEAPLVGADDAPLPPDWLDEAAELTGQATAPESDWMGGVEEVPRMVSSELPSAAEADTEAAAATSAEDEAAWLFSLGEAEEPPPEDEKAAESPPTGFTGLLEEIQTQRAAQETLWDEDEESAAEPEPPDWLSDFVESDGERVASAEPGVSEPPAADAESAADLFQLFEETDAESAPPTTKTPTDVPSSPAEAQPAEEPPAPLDAPEWLVEPEYDFFAPEKTEETAPAESAPAASVEHEPAPQDEADDWLSKLDEADESDLANVLLDAADEWQTAEQQAETLDWLSEPASEPPSEETEVEALFASVEEAAQAAAPQTPASEESAAEPSEEDWLAALPEDEEAVLTTAEAEDASEAELSLSEGEAAVRSVLDTLEADVPKLEESADEPLAFEAVEESLFGGEEDAEVTPPRTSSLEQRVAQIAESEDSPAWLAEMEAEASAEVAPSFSDEEQAIQYRAAGQTGILQPDETPAWMAAFTGEDVPEEPEVEPTEEGRLGAPEAVITPPEAPVTEQADEFSTRILQPETPVTADSFDLFDQEPSVPAEEEAPLDTDELFADVLGEMAEAQEEAESAAEGELPAWLQAITQSEADKLDETAFEEIEPYSSSAEDSGILQPGQEDEWLQVLGDEREAGAAPMAEAPLPEADEADLLSFLGVDATDAKLSAEAPAAETESGAPEEDEALLDFLDVDAAAIAEMDFEGIAAELEEAARAEPKGTESTFDALSEGGLSPDAAAEAPAFGTVAEASDLSHTMAEDAQAVTAPETADAAKEATASEDEFSFDGVVPRWLRRPREHLTDEATEVATDDESPPDPPEWLRDVSEDLDWQDRDDLQ